jgi:hypothetical protein
MQDDIRKYFLAHKEQLGKFPVFPDDQAGGSEKLLNPLMTPPAPPGKPAPPKTGKEKRKEKNKRCTRRDEFFWSRKEQLVRCAKIN